MRTLRIQAKCKDLCHATYTDEDETGKKLENHGYVPGGLGIDDGSDYIDITIDIDTGKIVDWQVPTEQALKDVFGE
jgi:hypothetical protein